MYSVLAARRTAKRLAAGKTSVAENSLLPVLVPLSQAAELDLDSLTTLLSRVRKQILIESVRSTGTGTSTTSLQDYYRALHKLLSRPAGTKTTSLDASLSEKRTDGT